MDRQGQHVELGPPHRRRQRLNLRGDLENLSDVFLLSLFSPVDVGRFFDEYERRKFQMIFSKIDYIDNLDLISCLMTMKLNRMNRILLMKMNFDLLMNMIQLITMKNINHGTKNNKKPFILISQFRVYKFSFNNSI